MPMLAGRAQVLKTALTSVLLNLSHVMAFEVVETREGRSECNLWLSDGSQVVAFMTDSDVELLKRA